MRIDSLPKLFFALLGILVGFNLPEIWAFIQGLFR